MDGLVNQCRRAQRAILRFARSEFERPYLATVYCKTVRAREHCSAISLRAALEDREPALPELLRGAIPEPLKPSLVRTEQCGLHVREEGIQVATGADHVALCRDLGLTRQLPPHHMVGAWTKDSRCLHHLLRQSHHHALQ